MTVRRQVFGLILAVQVCGGGCAKAVSLPPHGIPFKPDPPPAIDGRLDEWSSVPNAWVLDSIQHVTYGANRWKSPADLSAKVWLAWRSQYLYLAVDVTDDRIVQKGEGTSMWKGDHIELYLDAAPDAEPARTTFGVGQMQFGFSPGNFETTGDPEVDRAPEAVVFKPENGSGAGILVAARKTATGYSLEAAVPWTLISKLGDQDAVRPEIGTQLGVEVGISDTDGAEPRQEKMMTLLTSAWDGTRGRLLPAVLAPANGVAPPTVHAFDVFKTVEVPPNSSRQIRFDAPPVPAGREAVLTLRGRLENPKVAGYSNAMQLILNGTALDGKRLSNKSAREEMRDGYAESTFMGNGFTVPYAPDYESADRDANYAFRNSMASRFEIRVTDLLKSGENVLAIQDNIGAHFNYSLVVGDGRLEFREPAIARARLAAPTGPLAVFAPAPVDSVRYKLLSDTDGLILKVGSDTFTVSSRYSTPDGSWRTGSNRFFSVRRTLEKIGEAVVVRDTFTNLTDENLPLIQQHAVTADTRFKKVWLGGLSSATLAGSSSDPANPTTYVATGTVGVGLMPFDDVSQVHVSNFSDNRSAYIADDQFVLKPGATHTAQWAIIPTATPDYYAFLNAARRLCDANFTIDGSFCFLRANPRAETDKWTNRQFVDFVRFKSAKFVCDDNEWPTYKGVFPHGTALQTLDWSYFKKQIARLRALLPGVEHLAYFHCFIDVLEGSDKKYANARLLRSDGMQADYGKPIYKIFVPTTSNAFGRDVSKNVDLILAPQPAGFGCDGVYWDEFEYCLAQYHYDDFSKPDAGLPWDGVSADIDPISKKIVRLKSSTTLLSQPFRLALATRILAHGPLVGNGQPLTRTMAALHFPRFVETGSIANCAKAQFFSPIALGDHLTERSEVDAYRDMLRALDYGCVYYWYSDLTVIPTYPTLTSYMFPITPVELHDGYIIGRERIVTNRSGLFGWNDNSRHEVHVFDDQGREVSNFTAPTVVRDGKTFTELRLAEDWSAAIVRADAASRTAAEK